jgi:hypothetical protein
MMFLTGIVSNNVLIGGVEALPLFQTEPEQNSTIR